MATLISVPGAYRAHTAGGTKRFAELLVQGLKDGHRLLARFRNGEPSMLNAA